MYFVHWGYQRTMLPTDIASRQIMLLEQSVSYDTWIILILCPTRLITWPNFSVMSYNYVIHVIHVHRMLEEQHKWLIFWARNIKYVIQITISHILVHHRMWILTVMHFSQFNVLFFSHVLNVSRFLTFFKQVLWNLYGHLGIKWDNANFWNKIMRNQICLQILAL